MASDDLDAGTIVAGKGKADGVKVSEDEIPPVAPSAGPENGVDARDGEVSSAESDPEVMPEAGCDVAAAEQDAGSRHGISSDGKFCVFDAGVQGYSHKIEGLPYQDHSLKVDCGDYKLITVCDGHGGGDYFRSDRGSRFAAESFAVCMKKAFEKGEDGKPVLSSQLLGGGNKDEIFRQIVRSVVGFWRERVYADVAEHPFDESEMGRVSEESRAVYLAGDCSEVAYGSTFVGAVVTKDFWFAIQIGDGDCICFDESGKPHHLVPEDEKCIGNVTTSICDEDAVNEARYYFGKEIPLAVFVASDGVDKGFGDLKSLADFYRNLIMSFFVIRDDAKDDDLTESYRDICNYLPKLSEQGSRDDVTVAGVMDMFGIERNIKLFERKKDRFLKIMRIGNLGARSIDDDYCQRERVKLSGNSVEINLADCFCGGFGKGVQSVRVEADGAGMRIVIGGIPPVILDDSNKFTGSYSSPDGFDIISFRYYER